MKKILTNYIFRFLFEELDTFRNGDLLECQGDLFIFDDENGNPNKLKYYFKQNGFWNYIKSKNGSIYNISNSKFLSDVDNNSQGYKGLEYYKNSSIREANEQEREIYKNAKYNIHHK